MTMDFIYQLFILFCFVAVVLALAAHLAGGVRILALEFLPWRDWQKTLAATALAATLGLGVLFALATGG